ncbi:MAG: TonB-dependent receptor, partial [Bryobacteraceae bacterium]
YRIPSPFKSGFGKTLLGGWGVESLLTARTGMPVNLIGSTVTIDGLIFTSRPDVVYGVPQRLYGPQYPGGMAFNKAAFVSAGTTRQGTMGRGVLRGFGLVQENFTIQRQFRVTERVGLQFRTEFFNIFNHPNFGPPGSQLTSALFGLSTQALATSMGGLNALYQTGGPRSIQFAMRLQF